jgi:hypothetical protein
MDPNAIDEVELLSLHGRVLDGGVLNHSAHRVAVIEGELDAKSFVFHPGIPDLLVVASLFDLVGPVLQADEVQRKVTLF